MKDRRRSLQSDPHRGGWFELGASRGLCATLWEQGSGYVLLSVEQGSGYVLLSVEQGSGYVLLRALAMFSSGLQTLSGHLV